MEPGPLTGPARLAGRSLLRLQSDARLTELARAGHEPAFAAIVDRYRPALLGYCTRILGPERAEDAVQQALAGAHQAMTSGDERPLQLRPWLYRIAHNAALNVLRARRDEAALGDAEIAGGRAPDEALAQRERLEEILAAIATLPPAQRDALLLRELEGRSHEEIADALGVSRGAARAVVFRARAAVRAACTALTPSPLLLRVAELAAAGGGEHAAGTVAKTAAGV
ncbi:MAG: sigma-70 family RNA polymerase sigma factor, partial [Solirubrobacteraceae bacterium]|nr:sigma-70 family RNA polymerase sigma factor [Solirubrobacteraceae bacterium]